MGERARSFHHGIGAEDDRDKDDDHVNDDDVECVDDEDDDDDDDDDYMRYSCFSSQRISSSGEGMNSRRV